MLDSTKAASEFIKGSGKFTEIDIDNLWKSISFENSENEGRHIKNSYDIKQEKDNDDCDKKDEFSMKKSQKCNICGQSFPMGGKWKYERHIEERIKNDQLQGGNIEQDGFFMDEALAPDVLITEEEHNMYSIKVDDQFVIDEKMVPEGFKRKFSYEKDNRRRVYIFTRQGALLHMRHNDYSPGDIAIVEQISWMMAGTPMNAFQTDGT